MTKTMHSTEGNRDMWKKLFEDCNKKQRGGRALEARVQRAIIAADVDDSRRKSDTYKENSSRTVPDGTFDASRVESNDGDATPSYNWSTDNPRPD